MKQSPGLRPVLWDALVAAAVAVLAVACAVLTWRGTGETGQCVVAISVDGREVERCLLEEFPAEQTYTGNGYTIQVTRTETDDGRPAVQVAQSDCPTQDCVHTGRISRSGQSIVCLPARIIVELEGSGPAGETAPELVIG